MSNMDIAEVEKIRAKIPRYLTASSRLAEVARDDLQPLLARLDEAERENQRLRDLLGMFEEDPDGAKVIARLDEAERQMGSVAEGAIDLFLEYRDVHGYSEESAKNQALIDMAEALSVELPAIEYDPETDA